MSKINVTDEMNSAFWAAYDSTSGDIQTRNKAGIAAAIEVWQRDGGREQQMKHKMNQDEAVEHVNSVLAIYNGEGTKSAARYLADLVNADRATPTSQCDHEWRCMFAQGRYCHKCNLKEQNWIPTPEKNSFNADAQLKENSETLSFAKAEAGDKNQTDYLSQAVDAAEIATRSAMGDHQMACAVAITKLCIAVGQLRKGAGK